MTACPLRYNQREFLDGSQESERKVSAKRDAAGGTGRAEIEKPEQRTLELTPDTVFSIEHQKRLLRLAVAGGTHDSSVVFDGSDDSSGLRAITFIGPRKAPGQAKMSIAGPAGEALSKLVAWPMTISFYSIKTGRGAGRGDACLSDRLHHV